ncbi:MAG: PD40 domain-containing protein [Candidatus Wallbacteria bacterium]|nr:PD40 domain-containing protein [Candidatus Wallbacteria bacterium]
MTFRSPAPFAPLLALVSCLLTPLAAGAAGPKLPAGMLAYHEKAGSQTEIFVSVDGGVTARNLSLHPAEDLAPRLSPDGVSVVFQSTRAGKSHLFVVGVSGGVSPTQLTSGPTIDQAPCWSADGRSIYFESHRGTAWQICKIGIHGGEVTVLGPAGHDALAPKVSPDGSRIACQLRKESSEVWRVGLLDGDGKLIWESAAGASEFNETPAFSADAKDVLFAASGPDGYQFWSVATTGKDQPRQLTRFPGWKLHPLAVGSTSLLLFDEKTPAGWRLCLFDMSTGGHAVIDSAHDRFQPDFRATEH